MGVDVQEAVKAVVGGKAGWAAMGVVLGMVMAGAAIAQVMVA